MQQTSKLTSLSFARKLAAASGAPAGRRLGQPHAVDIQEVTPLATGHDRLSEGQPDTYAQRLMKQLSGLKVA